jgi:hypothetical protein
MTRIRVVPKARPPDRAHTTLAEPVMSALALKFGLELFIGRRRAQAPRRSVLQHFMKHRSGKPVPRRSPAAASCSPRARRRWRTPCAGAAPKVVPAVPPCSTPCVHTRAWTP